MRKPSSHLCQIVLLGCALLSNSNSAAQTPTQVLQQTAAVYRNLGSYEFQVTVQTIRGTNVAEQHLTEMGLRPGKFRIEDSDPQGELRIADGKDQWAINRSTNEYKKTAQPPELPSPINDLENIDQHVSEAEFAREELFVVDGKSVRVVVVRVIRDRWSKGTLQGAMMVMYRIDESNFRVYKAITYSPEATQIVLYSIRNWNQPVSDTSFAFAPPPSSKNVSSVRQQAGSLRPLLGSQAPDFTLQDANGHSVSLHALLGKVVIVDFWASWCGPCRDQMPELQRLSQESARSGLVVLGLNVGETADDVIQFARENSYTFPLLLAAEPDVSAKYFVDRYPTTFVVDRQGIIVFTSIGSDSPDRIRSVVAVALRR